MVRQPCRAGGPESAIAEGQRHHAFRPGPAGPPARQSASCAVSVDTARISSHGRRRGTRCGRCSRAPPTPHRAAVDGRLHEGGRALPGRALARPAGRDPGLDPRVRPGAGATELLAAARALVVEPEREFAYVAIDLVRPPRAGPARVQPPRPARPGPRTSLVGHRGRVVDSDRPRSVCGTDHGTRTSATWAADERLWVRRIALVFQVGRREAVDLGLLFAACRANFADRDFFMRKGDRLGPARRRTLVPRRGSRLRRDAPRPRCRGSRSARP